MAFAPRLAVLALLATVGFVSCRDTRFVIRRSSVPVSTHVGAVPPLLDSSHLPAVNTQKSFREFCIELITNSTNVEQQAVAANNGTAQGDTIVARTVGEDGATLSVENNPEDTELNDLQVAPVIFNIADVNLVVEDDGVAMFVPFKPLNKAFTLEDLQNGGLEVFLQQDQMQDDVKKCLHT